MSALLIAVVLLSGCVDEISNNATVTPSPTPLPSVTPCPTPTPFPSPSPSPSPTPTSEVLKKEIPQEIDTTPALAYLLYPCVSNITREDIGFEITLTDDVFPLTEIGKPKVPYIIKKFKISGGSEVESVSVNLSDPLEIYNIFIEPAQPPVPSKYDIWQNFTYPPYTINNETYASHEPYPGKEYKYKVSDHITWKRVVVYIYPIQYIPAKNKIIAYKNASISIFYHVRAQEGRS